MKTLEPHVYDQLMYDTMELSELKRLVGEFCEYNKYVWDPEHAVSSILNLLRQLHEVNREDGYRLV